MAALFASPSPSRVKHCPPSPYHPPTSTIGYPSPAMSPKAAPTSDRDSILSFFKRSIPTSMLDLGQFRGYLFDYKFDPKHPNHRDRAALKDWSTLLLLHLAENPNGMFREVEIRNALEGLQEFTGKSFDKTYSLKLQAGNYTKMFSDIRATKRDCTTGTRLDPVIKQLVKAMDSGMIRMFGT